MDELVAALIATVVLDGSGKVGMALLVVFAAVVAVMVFWH